MEIKIKTASTDAEEKILYNCYFLSILPNPNISFKHRYNHLWTYSILASHVKYLILSSSLSQNISRWVYLRKIGWKARIIIITFRLLTLELNSYLITQ